MKEKMIYTLFGFWLSSLLDSKKWYIFYLLAVAGAFAGGYYVGIAHAV